MFAYQAIYKFGLETQNLLNILRRKKGREEKYLKIVYFEVILLFICCHPLLFWELSDSFVLIFALGPVFLLLITTAWYLLDI